MVICQVSFGCVTSSMKKFAKAEAAKLASELKEPLLSELKRLLQQGHRGEAIKKYSKEAGTDMTTAVQVINALESANNQ
jgi:hypothetical protein